MAPSTSGDELSGIKFTCPLMPCRSRANDRAWSGASLIPAIKTYSIETRRPVASTCARAAVTISRTEAEGIRHQTPAQCVIGRMQGDGEVDLGMIDRETPDAAQDADRGDGDAPGAHGEGIGGGEAGEGGVRGGVIGQRLAHAHEGDVGERRILLGRARGNHEYLRKDFPHPELAAKPLGAGGAEDAAHGAARLGRDADRPSGPSLAKGIVAHEHGFHEFAIIQAKKPFRGGAVSYGLFRRDHSRRDAKTRAERVPQALREFRDRLEIEYGLRIDGLANLVRAVGRLAQLRDQGIDRFRVQIQQRGQWGCR